MFLFIFFLGPLMCLQFVLNVSSDLCAISFFIFAVLLNSCYISFISRFIHFNYFNFFLLHLTRYLFASQKR